jgi:MFS family permease
MPRLSASTSETIRDPVFSRFFSGITIANIGQFLQNLAVPFLVNDLTDSNAWVGAASFAVLIPAVIGTPVAGILADRINRKTILLSAYALQCALSVVFITLYETGELTPWRILILQFATGVIAGFQWAPIQSMSAVLVEPRLLIDAVRLVSISFTAGRTIGPAIAAVLLVTSGPGLAFIGTLGCYVVATAFVASVRSTYVSAETTERFLSQFFSGIRYIRQRAGMRLAMVTQAVIAFFAAVFTFALTASIADDAYGVGGGGLGALAMFAGLGSIVGTLYITGPGSSVSRSNVQIIAITTYAAGVLIGAATPYLAVGMVGFLCLGAAHMLSAVNLSTALQVQVDEQYRGRVMSVWLMVTLAFLPISALIGGFLADVFHIRVVMAIFGSALLLFVIVRASVGAGFTQLDDDKAATPESDPRV